MLSLFFFLLFLGLVIRHYYVQVPPLVYLNTIIVVLLAFVTTWRATLIAMEAFSEWRKAKQDNDQINQWRPQ